MKTKILLIMIFMVVLLAGSFVSATLNESKSYLTITPNALEEGDNAVVVLFLKADVNGQFDGEVELDVSNNKINLNDDSFPFVANDFSGSPTSKVLVYSWEVKAVNTGSVDIDVKITDSQTLEEFDFSDSATITSKKEADLEIEQVLYSDSEIEIGEQFTIKARVKNVGNENDENVKVKVIAPSFVNVAYPVQTISSLNVGQYKWVEFNAVAVSPGGESSVLISANGDNSDIISKTQDITVSEAIVSNDLSVSNILISDVVQKDDSIPIQVKVFNNGKYSESSKIRIYVNDEKIKEKSFSLGSQNVYNFEFNYEFENQGIYVLKAVVDCVSGESDLENNEKQKIILSVSEEEPTEAVCGNGVLEEGESCDDGLNNGQYKHDFPGYCKSDCSGYGSYCGDGICQSEEDYETCPEDCEEGPTEEYECIDSDGGKDYYVFGKASLQVSPTRIRSYKDSCKNRWSNFLGDFDNNKGPGGGPVIKGKQTPYLYEAICKRGKPSMIIKKCKCLNGVCIN